MSFDQLMEGRTLISQDVSPLVDMEATFTTEDWDYPGFTVIAACGDGEFLENSGDLEIAVVNSAGITDDFLEDVKAGKYQYLLTNVGCYEGN
ncbi:hypothetical protein VR010_06510 [Actinomycetaceae bacterium L2_0104]